MPHWTDIAAASDCPPGEGREVVAGGRVLALFNVDGTFYLLDGVCPHQGGPLGRGALAGCVVTCPWHGWQFDVRTGQHQLNPRIVHPAFEVKVERGRVLADLPPEAS
jgi:nitrite reductase/ring-hydroxylating ferredoxin subunit